MGIHSFSFPLTWSYSKSETLNKCKRKYFYTYYSGFIKDEVNPSQEQWDLYLKVLLFKNLKTADMWIGTMTHTVISRALISLQNGDMNLHGNIESEFKKTAGRIKSDIEKSKVKNYSKYDKNSKWGLIEHAFGEDVDSEEIILKFRTALKSYLELAEKDELLKAVIDKIPGDENKNLKCFIEDPDNSDWDSKKTRIKGINADLYILPDFFIETEKNKFLILDWKTGVPITDNNIIPDQLKAYALKLMSELNDSENEFIEIKGYYFFLPSGEKIGGIINNKSVLEFRNKIHSDIEYMKTFLTDGNITENIPVPLNYFSLTENLSECQSCCFKIICRKN